MKIQTQKCVLYPPTGDWVLVPDWVEVNSPAELDAALKKFAAEVERFQGHTGNAGGGYGEL